MEREQLRVLIERLVREELSRLRAPEGVTGETPDLHAPRGRALITADDVEAAAKGEKRLVAANAIVTPLARDRAKELGVKFD